MSVSNGVLLAILMLSGGNVCRGHHRFGTEVVEVDLGTIDDGVDVDGEIETEYYVEYTGVGVGGSSAEKAFLLRRHCAVRSNRHSNRREGVVDSEFYRGLERLAVGGGSIAF